MNIRKAANRYAGVIRWVSVALIALGFFLTARAFPFGRAVLAFEGWVDRFGFLGPVVFGFVYVIASLLLLPAAVLTFAAGAIFGVVEGVIVVSLAATTASAAAFLIARYLARNRIARIVRHMPRFAAMDRAIGEAGAKVVALLRLSPIVPYTISNYVFGLTSVRFWPYVLATWVFMLPGTIVYVYVGHFGTEQLTLQLEPKASRSPVEWAWLLGGLIATAGAAVYLTRLARRQLKAFAELEEGGEEEIAESKEMRHGWPWTAMALAALAALWLITAVIVNFNQDAIQRLFDFGRTTGG